MLPTVKESNPNLKDRQIIFDYIEKMKRQKRAPKITGMFIQLSFPQKYMNSYSNFKKNFKKLMKI